MEMKIKIFEQCLPLEEILRLVLAENHETFTFRVRTLSEIENLATMLRELSSDGKQIILLKENISSVIGLYQIYAY